MVTREVRLYVEGGGDESQGKARLREGFSKFLRPVIQRCRDLRVGWKVIACGSRNATYDAFSTAQRSHPDATAMLLVDAEDPVEKAPWEHLKNRDRWGTERDSDERYHLMVLTMESWLLADPEALGKYYGKGFRANALPAPGRVEALGKVEIERCLRLATQGTKKGPYHKIRHGPELLGELDSSRVRREAPHCERLFHTLHEHIERWRRS